MSYRIAVNLLVVGILGAFVAGATSPRPTLESVGDSLICQCGCNYPLNSCLHMNCSSQAEMYAHIQEKIANGKEQEAILQDLVLRYGEKVLASPPAKGFNLFAWILPGVGVIAGLVVVIVVARRWRVPPRESAKALVAPVDPKLLAAVEEEMKRIGG